MDDHEDIQIEVEEEHESAQAGVRISKLRDDIAACRKEKQEYMDGWQRAKADYVNLLKRFEEEKKAEYSHGIVAASEVILPAFDALERAKEHGEIPAHFSGIAKQLESAFTTLGFEPIGEKGESFNPAFHEAFGQDVTNIAAEDDTVTAVLEKGWRIKGKVIRPAKVRIAHFSE